MILILKEISSDRDLSLILRSPECDVINTELLIEVTIK